MDKLLILTDLTLYSNQISKVENLGNLRELTVLSLGNNKLKSLGNLLSEVRHLKKLQVLNVAGNPLNKESNYKECVIFHLSSTLKYLNYEFIDKNMRSSLGNADKYRLEEMDDHQEDLSKKKDEISLKDFEEVGIGCLYRYDEVLLKENNELHDLLQNENIFETSKNAFKEAIKTLIEKILNEVRSEVEKKTKKIKFFQESSKKIEELAESDTLSLMRGYFDRKKICKLACEDKVYDWKQQVQKILSFIVQLDSKLMNREVQLMMDSQVRRVS